MGNLDGGDALRQSALSGLSVTIAACLAVCPGGPASGDEWPQWRGPNRDGIWRETGIIGRFDGPEVPLTWRVPILGGYSGPTVADGRVFVTDRMTEPESRERVLCFAWDTGDKLWSYDYACNYRKVAYTTGPRASVTVDNGQAYSLGTMGHLLCFDAATGGVIWQRDLQTEYRLRVPTWGIAAAPVVEGDLLIAHVGGADGACIIGLDKLTGEERWQALDDRASYSAPVVIEQAGRRVLVCWTGDRVAGLAPESGELLWDQAFPPTQMVHNISTPVVHGRWLFVSSFFDGSMLLRLGQERPSVELAWHRMGKSEKDTDALHCCISTPLLDDGHIYGIDAYGMLRCLDIRTGDRIWESADAVPQARWANVHMVRNGDKVWMLNERGDLIIARLTPAGYHEISRARLIAPTKGQLGSRGGVVWGHPAFAYRHVFARSDEELVCASLEAQ